MTRFCKSAISYVNIDRLPPEFPFDRNIFCINNFFFIKPNNVKVIPIFALIKVNVLQSMKTSSNS